MKKIIIVVLFLFYQQSYAQTFLWAGQLKGSVQDIGKGIVTDTSGNVYTVGLFYGTVDFNPGTAVYNLTSAGGGDIYILKLNKYGEFIWACRMGGASEDNATSVTTDITGNVYVTGFYRLTADFNPDTNITYSLTANGGKDVFIAKLDSGGNFIWAKSFGATHEDEVFSIELDDSANVYTTGYFSDTVDFNPGSGVYNLITYGPTDIYISKLDSSGNFVWAKQIGGKSFYETSYDIALDDSFNVYVTGSFRDTVDFDPGSGTFFLMDSITGNYIFVLKLKSNGDFVWAKAMGGNTTGFGISIIIDKNYNVITTGGFEGTIDFDPGPGVYNIVAPPGYWQVFISKLNSNGNFIWAGRIGSGNGDVNAYAVAVDDTGNVYVTGDFYNFCDFDPGTGSYTLVSSGHAALYILKLKANGNFAWVKVADYSFGYSIFIDALNSIYVTGRFFGTVDFNPGIPVYNLVSTSTEAYFLKLGNCTAPPNAGTISGAASVCGASTGSYSVSAVAGATGYTWTVPSGATINSGQNSTTISVTFGTTGGNITVAASYLCGSTTSSQLAVTVNPVLSISPAAPSFCNGDSVTLTASGASSYTWSPATGLNTTSGAVVKAKPTASITYTLTGTSGSCSNIKTVAVTVNQLPSITTIPVSPSFCAGSFVNITAYGANTYTWSPATGLSATTGASVTATPSVTTTYTITGTSIYGCVSTKTVTVTVDSVPTIAASPSAPSYCTSGSVSITASGANTYSWSPATGLSATTGATVVASPTSTTTYNITGTTAAGCTNTKTVTVTVNNNPNLNVSPAFPSFCEGSSVTITAGGANTYSWSPATGLNTTNGATVIANPTTTTTYTITGTSSVGCISTKTVTVTVNTLPSISTLPVSPSYCAGGSVSITAYGAFIYSWSPATGLNVVSGATVTANPALTTTYTITGTSSSGCTNTKTVTVVVDSLPTITTSPVSPSLCSGDSVAITANGAYSYIWSPATGLSSTTGSTVFAKPVNTTTYTITGTSLAGCTKTKTVIVTVNQKPNVSVSPVSPTLCEGDSVVLTAGGADTYVWSPSTGLSSTSGAIVTARPNATTTYTVTGTTTLGCTNTKTFTVNVNLVPQLSTLPVSPSFCSGGSVTITASGADTYSWSPGTGLNKTIGATVIANPINTTTYTITGANVTGCWSTKQVTVTVNPLPLKTISVNGFILSSMENNSTYQWIHCPSFAIISGATNQNYTATVNGDYAVIVSKNGCVDTSDCVTINKIGIDPSTKEIQYFLIHPNPNRGSFIISSEFSGEYSIINNLGQKISSFELNDLNNFTSAFENMSRGVYFIIGKNRGQNIRQKLIVIQ